MLFAWIKTSRIAFGLYSLLLILLGGGLCLPLIMFTQSKDTSVTENIALIQQNNHCPRPLIIPNTPPQKPEDIFALKQKLFDSQTQIAILKADIQDLNKQIENFNKIVLGTTGQQQDNASHTPKK